MSSAGPALLAAAAGVGFGHAILPDHWMPLAVVGRVERYPPRRLAALATVAGIAHVLVSIILGAIIIAIGLQFRSSIEHAQAAIVGTILIATGLAFAAVELTGRGHRHGPGGHVHHHPGHDGHGHSHGQHHEHPDGRDHGRAHNRPHPAGQGHVSRRRDRLALMVPFGAAASPDLTILPVFLAAAAAGSLTAVGSLVVFAAVTITTIVTLTMLASRGGSRFEAPWLDRWGNLFTATVLVAIGVLVLTDVL